MRLQEKALDDAETARVMLYSLLKSNSELREWFGEKHNLKDDDEEEYYSHYISKEEIWDVISGMSYDEAREDLK